MKFEIVKTLTNDAGDERILIILRGDGVATYRRQWSRSGGWGDIGPECGLYDTTEAAENEARARTQWLVPHFH